MDRQSETHRRTARQTETDGPMDRQKTGRAHPPSRTHARTHAHTRTRARARTHARATACVLMDEGTSGPIMLSSFYHDSCAMPAGLLGDPVIDGHMGGVHGVHRYQLPRVQPPKSAATAATAYVKATRGVVGKGEVDGKGEGVCNVEDRVLGQEKVADHGGTLTRRKGSDPCSQ